MKVHQHVSLTNDSLGPLPSTEIRKIAPLLESSGVDKHVVDFVQRELLSNPNHSTTSIGKAIEAAENSLVEASGIVTISQATRAGFLKEWGNSRVGEVNFADTCRQMISSPLINYARVRPSDDEVILRLAREVRMRIPQKGDSYEGTVVGNLQSISCVADRLLLSAGIEDESLRDTSTAAICRRIGIITASLACDSANVILTCRVRDADTPLESYGVHFDGTFLPRNEGSSRVETKAVFALTVPTTLLWDDGVIDRDSIFRADMSERMRLAPRDKARELLPGEILVFKTGDPQQALIHAVPPYPATMSRILVQVNPLTYSDVGPVWLREQKSLVERTLGRLVSKS